LSQPGSGALAGQHVGRHVGRHVGLRMGLFGGSFDPPHIAHLALARVALQTLALDQLRWLPAGQPWQKPRSITAAQHREAMLELMLQAVAEPRFVIDRRELRRAGPSFTIDTVHELRAEHPQATLFLIIGQDQFAGLHTWRDWQALLKLVVLGVAQRPGVVAAVHADVQRAAQHLVPLPMMDVSATDIRRRVSQGLPIDALVPPEVARYIAHHGLYANQPKDAAAH
jgi:nicotinate-nucleotide adenylyltransferase